MMINTNNTITTTAGTAFEQRFQAAPSAGYCWSVDSLPAEVQFIGKSHIPSERNAPGDPATVVFRFKALSVGTFVLRFLYKRPWEKLGNTFEVVVRVLPA
jgi:predicted secreted protein